jgi:hypothetical protein
MTMHVIYLKKSLPYLLGEQRCCGSGSLQMRTRLRADRNLPISRQRNPRLIRCADVSDRSDFLMLRLAPCIERDELVGAVVALEKLFGGGN